MLNPRQRDRVNPGFCGELFLLQSAPLPVEPFPPSICCIKDTINTREICWTLRGEDEAVSHRVQRVLTFLDKLKAAVLSSEATIG